MPKKNWTLSLVIPGDVGEPDFTVELPWEGGILPPTEPMSLYYEIDGVSINFSFLAEGRLHDEGCDYSNCFRVTTQPQQRTHRVRLQDIRVVISDPHQDSDCTVHSMVHAIWEEHNAERDEAAKDN